MGADWVMRVREAMAVATFALGLATCAAGVWTILAREYRQTLRGLTARTERLQARGVGELGVVPVIDASARLVEAVAGLIRTAMGVGAFLCLVGLTLCLVAFWMLA